MKWLFDAIVQSFDFGRKGRFDAAWEEFKQLGGARLRLPEDPVLGVDLERVHRAAAACPVQPHLASVWQGPEAIGLPVKVGAGEIPASVLMLHFAMVAWQSIVHDLGFSTCYGGFAHPPSEHRIQLALWVHGANTRMLVAPIFQHDGRSISLAVAHVVLWKQPWMESHPDTHWWWASLSSDYGNHFEADGGTYCEASAAWKAGQRRFRHGAFGGVDFDAAQGRFVYRDELLGSFYHFHIGSEIMPSGSEQGLYLRAIRNRLLELGGRWREVYSSFGSGSQSPPQNDPHSVHHPIIPKF